MKSFFVLLVSVYAINMIHAQTWTWSTETPKAGETINVDVKNLDPKGEIHFVAFSFNEKDNLDVNYVADVEGLNNTPGSIKQTGSV
jgi:hypothetical protein